MNKIRPFYIKIFHVPFLVVNWGLKKGKKRAFRPAMALSTGELSGLGGKLLLMTATATKKTMRVLQDQFPEVSKWKIILNIPNRSNVTILVPPPHLIPTNFETTLVPFVTDMKEKNTTYLILVRGRWIVQSIPSSCLLSHISILPMSKADSYLYSRQLYHTLVHSSLGYVLNIYKGHLKMLCNSSLPDLPSLFLVSWTGAPLEQLQILVEP